MQGFGRGPGAFQAHVQPQIWLGREVEEGDEVCLFRQPSGFFRNIRNIKSHHLIIVKNQGQQSSLPVNGTLKSPHTVYNTELYTAKNASQSV
jgi:hypothetical protein